MNTPKLRSLSRLAAAVAVLALSACTTGIRQHPEFAARRQAIRSVAVIPPEVTVRLITFTGEDQPIPELERQVREKLPALVAAELASRGFAVPHATSIESRLGEVPALRFQTTQLQQNFAQAEAEMFRTAQMATAQAENYRRSLGAQVARVSDPLEADALVLVRVQGFQKSGGEIAKDMAKSIVVGVLTGYVAVQPTSGTTMSVAFVDGRSGDVLWANAAGMPSDPSGALEGLVKQAFAAFPAPAATIAAAPAASAAASPAPAAEPSLAGSASASAAADAPPVYRSAASLTSSANRTRPMPQPH
jgi:hypothetical protein